MDKEYVMHIAQTIKEQLLKFAISKHPEQA